MPSLHLVEFNYDFNWDECAILLCLAECFYVYLREDNTSSYPKDLVQKLVLIGKIK